MNYHEKKSLVTLSTQIITSVAYVLHSYNKHADLAPDADLIEFWARTLVFMIPVFIAAHVAALVVFAVANQVITGEGFPKFTDERDRLIELKALRVEYFTTTFGIFSFALSVMLDKSTSWAFAMLMGSMLSASIFGSITRYNLYRKDS